MACVLAFQPAQLHNCGLVSGWLYLSAKVLSPFEDKVFVWLTRTLGSSI